MSDDRALLLAWRTHADESAFRALCDQYASLVAASCRRMGSPDPDEAAQATFLILARRAGSVDGQQLAGWLTTTARRVVAHQHRAAKRRRTHEHEAAMEQVRQHSGSAEPAWAEARQHLDAALAKLSPGRREAVVRFYLQGRAQAEIAAELGCSVDAVKTRVHEGIEHLRRFFARRGAALGAAALASGLASEAATADHAAASSCANAVITPASAPGAVHLVSEITTAMLISKSVLIAATTIVLGTCLTAAVSLGGEAPPAPKPAPLAQPAVQHDPSANAALVWWRAFDRLPDDKDPIWHIANSLRSQLPAMPANDLFSSVALGSLRQLTYGAALPYCDWGIDVRREGNAAMLPHISHFRNLIRLGLLRARWHAAREEPRQAVDDLLTCLRACRLYPGQRPVVGDVLASVSTEAMSIAAFAQLLPRLPPVQQRRLAEACAAVPISALVADTLDRENDLMWWLVDLLLKTPQQQRASVAINNAGAAPDISIDNLSDDKLIACRDAYPAEIARWQHHLRLPLADRLRPLKPTFTTGDRAPHVLMEGLLLAHQLLAANEARQLQRLRQVVAAVAYLERGDAALAEVADPVSGKPFRFEKTATGFRLLADIPGQKKGAELLVGEAPATEGPGMPESVIPSGGEF